jgi:hypothetical protein
MFQYDHLDKLPKALSEAERIALETVPGGLRVLCLVDALTETMAEAVARMTIAEMEVDATKAEIDRLRGAYARLKESYHLSQTELDAIHLAKEVIALHNGNVAKIAKANALIERAVRFDTNDPNALQLVVDMRAYLSESKP